MEPRILSGYVIKGSVLSVNWVTRPIFQQETIASGCGGQPGTKNAEFCDARYIKNGGFFLVFLFTRHASPEKAMVGFG